MAGAQQCVRIGECESYKRPQVNTYPKYVPERADNTPREAILLVLLEASRSVGILAGKQELIGR
jgi:hypothetical protein